MFASLILTEDLDRYVADLAANGCVVQRNRHTGTVKVYDGDKVVLMAIQKGRNQPWIVRFSNTERIKWSGEAS